MSRSRRATIILTILLSSMASQPSTAQEFGREADQAFWCAAAYAGLVSKSGFSSPEQQQEALTDLARFEPAMVAEATRLGWQKADIESASLSYYAEVEPQLDDFLQWRDPAALRIGLDVCFPSVTFEAS